MNVHISCEVKYISPCPSLHVMLSASASLTARRYHIKLYKPSASAGFPLEQANYTASQILGSLSSPEPLVLPSFWHGTLVHPFPCIRPALFIC